MRCVLTMRPRLSGAKGGKASAWVISCEAKGQGTHTATNNSWRVSRDAFNAALQDRLAAGHVVEARVFNDADHLVEHAEFTPTRGGGSERRDLLDGGTKGAKAALVWSESVVGGKRVYRAKGQNGTFTITGEDPNREVTWRGAGEQRHMVAKVGVSRSLPNARTLAEHAVIEVTSRPPKKRRWTLERARDLAALWSEHSPIDASEFLDAFKLGEWSDKDCDKAMREVQAWNKKKPAGTRRTATKGGKAPKAAKAPEAPKAAKAPEAPKAESLKKPKPGISLDQVPGKYRGRVAILDGHVVSDNLEPFEAHEIAKAVGSEARPKQNVLGQNYRWVIVPKGTKKAERLARTPAPTPRAGESWKEYSTREGAKLRQGGMAAADAMRVCGQAWRDAGHTPKAKPAAKAARANPSAAALKEKGKETKKKRAPSPWNKFLGRRLPELTGAGVDAKDAMRQVAQEWANRKGK